MFWFVLVEIKLKLNVPMSSFDLDLNNVVGFDGSVLARSVFRRIHKVLVNSIELEEGRQERLTEHFGVSDEVFCVQRPRRDKEPPTSVEKLNGPLTSFS